MSTDVDDSFVDMFEREVKLDYQRQGAKMLNSVRRKMNVKGKSTTFQRIGKGSFGTKSRHGQVPILNLAHTPVATNLADYYGGEYVDKLDELKIEHDERAAVSTSISWAGGRKSDALIIAVGDAASNETTATGALTLAKVEEIFEYFGNNDVPDDNQRFLWVSPQGWTDLMGITQFSNADYVSSDQLPYKGMVAKSWHSFMIAQHSGLTKSGAVRFSLAWHKMAIGCASGQEVYIDITWQGKEQAHLVVGGMSQGAVEVDSTGVYILKHTEA